jgi:hypothetical protein
MGRDASIGGWARRRNSIGPSVRENWGDWVDRTGQESSVQDRSSGSTWEAGAYQRDGDFPAETLLAAQQNAYLRRFALVQLHLHAEVDRQWHFPEPRDAARYIMDTIFRKKVEEARDCFRTKDP